jgi:3-hydroxyacyl-[acyl-carrier-protein] dehydratase
MPADPVALGLPHREPFIFVDEVREILPGESAICAKTFPPEEPFFRGHFPGDPLVPGVILTEALAQTAGIAAGQPGRGFRLAAIRGL